MDEPGRERFVDLGRSTVPPSQEGTLGTYPDPYVVQVSVSGPRPYLALSIGSGHLGSGCVLPLEEVFLATGELDPRWAEEFDGADASWAIPILRALADGAHVGEAQLIDDFRRQHGTDPTIEMLPID